MTKQICEKCDYKNSFRSICKKCYSYLFSVPRDVATPPKEYIYEQQPGYLNRLFGGMPVSYRLVASEQEYHIVQLDQAPGEKWEGGVVLGQSLPSKCLKISFRSKTGDDKTYYIPFQITRFSIGDHILVLTLTDEQWGLDVCLLSESKRELIVLSHNIWLLTMGAMRDFGAPKEVRSFIESHIRDFQRRADLQQS